LSESFSVKSFEKLNPEASEGIELKIWTSSEVTLSPSDFWQDIRIEAKKKLPSK
jgi:hypothetical protein